MRRLTIQECETCRPPTAAPTPLRGFATRYNAPVRRLLNSLTALSLLLCVGAAAVWVRSYWREDALLWVRPSETVGDGERWIGVAWGEGIICLSDWRPGAGVTAAGMWRV